MTNLLSPAAPLLPLSFPVAAGAQSPPATPADTMEPGVNTSAPSQSPVAQGPTAQAPAATPPATIARPAKPGAAAAKPASAGAAANKPATQTAVKGAAKDRLDLESSQITGNRELPKVLYIVPWRSAQLGDLVGRPVNSLLDE